MTVIESMVERVARAICKNRGWNPDVSNIAANRFGMRWQAFEAEAREYIAALREPTEAMCIAGDVAQSAWEDRYNGGNARKAWEAMLDSALSS